MIITQHCPSVVTFCYYGHVTLGLRLRRAGHRLFQHGAQEGSGPVYRLGPRRTSEKGIGVRVTLWSFLGCSVLLTATIMAVYAILFVSKPQD